MAPITSGASQVGREQVNFARLAVDDFNSEHGANYTVAEFDTRLDATEAATQAQVLSEDPATIAVVGPSSSQEVAAAGPVLAEAGLAFVSGAATRPDLTNGSNPGFFRVVPDDGAQASTVVDFVTGPLAAEQVLVIAEQTGYGIDLADAVRQGLEGSGVVVDVVPVDEGATDYRNVVDRVPPGTDVVFATFQVAAKTQSVGELLRKDGSDAVMFGSESSFSPDFTLPGSYVSALAPLLDGVPAAQGVMERYIASYGSFGPYGAPTYVATQAVLDAAQRSCEASGASADRSGVLAELPATVVGDSILGRDVAFEANGDSKDAEFAVLSIDAGGNFVNAAGS